jgi:hypothetical protein
MALRRPADKQRRARHTRHIDRPADPARDMPAAQMDLALPACVLTTNRQRLKHFGPQAFTALRPGESPISAVCVEVIDCCAANASLSGRGHVLVETSLDRAQRESLRQLSRFLSLLKILRKRLSGRPDTAAGDRGAPQ